MAYSTLELQLRELKDMLSQSNELLRSQTKLIESLQESLKAKDAEIHKLTEQVAYLTKLNFGRSSAKQSIQSPFQTTLFDD